jgi:DNA polymerase-3 subunit delta'
MPFQNIRGHEKQVSILQSAMARNRMPHAYLFCGMEGVGKKTTALVVAKAMNCQKGRFDACDTCPSCLKIDHRNHPDVIRIEPEGQFIRIQEIRDLQDQMKFRPFEGGKRVIILVDADKMNSIAANALLKTLEEPTRNNFLILISSRPYQLPMTILSRCQHLRFNPLNRETVFQYLQERLSIAPEPARMLAYSSGGSIGRALEMIDEDYLSLRNQMMDRLSDERMKNPLQLLSFVNDFGQDRKIILERLDIMRICFRDALVYKETTTIDPLFNQDRLPMIRSFADKLSGTDLLRNIIAVDRACRAIDQNANKSLTLEAMMFKLALNERAGRAIF